MSTGRPTLPPELTVAAIVEADGRFMVVEERVAGKLVINQPAGHVEPGESLAAAVIREALEETAWTFVPEAVVGIYLWGRSQGQNPFLRVAFCGRCIAHDASRTLDDGIERVLRLRRADLVERAPQLRSPMVLRCIDDYMAGTRYPLDAIEHLAIDQLKHRAAVL